MPKFRDELNLSKVAGRRVLAMCAGTIAGSMGPGTIAGAMLVEGCRRGCATSASASAVSSRLLLSGREQEC